MPVRVVVSSIILDILIAVGEFFGLWKRIKVNSTIQFKLSGQVELVYLFERKTLSILVDLMKVFLHIWKKSIYVGDSIIRGEKYFIVVRPQFTIWEVEL